MSYKYSTFLCLRILEVEKQSSASTRQSYSSASVVTRARAVASSVSAGVGHGTMHLRVAATAASTLRAVSSSSLRAVSAVVARAYARGASSAQVRACVFLSCSSVAPAFSRARMDTVALVGDEQQPLPKYGLALVGDEQQPLPEYGLALTLARVTGAQGQHLFPAALYDGYKFNSFAVLDGVAYGAGDDGIYALSGGDETFTTRINLGRRDFGSRLRKCVRQIGVARVSGAARAVVTADGGTSYTYAVNAQRGDGRLERAVVGRGLIGTTLEIEVRGDQDLEIECVEAVIEQGARR